MDKVDRSTRIAASRARGGAVPSSGSKKEDSGVPALTSCRNVLARANEVVTQEARRSRQRYGGRARAARCIRARWGRNAPVRRSDRWRDPMRGSPNARRRSYPTEARRAITLGHVHCDGRLQLLLQRVASSRMSLQIHDANVRRMVSDQQSGLIKEEREQCRSRTPTTKGPER